MSKDRQRNRNNRKSKRVILVAYNNAKKLEKYQVTDNKNIESVEANPHSDVYQIIEELEK